MAFARHVFALVLALVVPRAAGGGIMRREAPKVSNLRAALEEVLSGDRAQRLFAIEGILRPTFEAFPKNSAGKIAMQSLHSMARDYFASEHGWLFSGFEFAGARSTKLQEAILLQKKQPKLVTALKEAETKEDGLSLSDTVLAIATVEHLVLEESKALLNTAYSLNEVPANTAVAPESLAAILTTYLMLFRKGKTSNIPDVLAHQQAKANFLKSMEDEGLTAFYKESVDAYGKGRWITQTSFEFTDSAQIVEDLALRYGKWQNAECEDMKQALVKLDSDHSGRVPLDVFHAQPKSPHYSFTETADYLREISSLDESHAGTPKVMIANYLASPSNCIAWSEYFSVCCLNECESLLNELESRVQTSDVPVDKLIETVASIPSGTVNVPRELPPRLVELARQLGAVHGGIVPMQSGDFRRWFHFAFPNECPYPTDLEANVAESERDATEKWLGQKRDVVAAPEGIDHQQTDDVPPIVPPKAVPAVPAMDL